MHFSSVLALTKRPCFSTQLPNYMTLHAWHRVNFWSPSVTLLLIQNHQNIRVCKFTCWQAFNDLLKWLHHFYFWRVTHKRWAKGIQTRQNQYPPPPPKKNWCGYKTYIIYTNNDWNKLTYHLWGRGCVLACWTAYGPWWVCRPGYLAPILHERCLNCQHWKALFTFDQKQNTTSAWHLL